MDLAPLCPQEILGHASLESTQLYTHVSIRKLQAIHAATHPAATPESTDPAEPADTDDAKADLLNELAVEADREADVPDEPARSSSTRPRPCESKPKR